jgi:hypothetical protein
VFLEEAAFGRHSERSAPIFVFRSRSLANVGARSRRTSLRLTPPLKVHRPILTLRLHSRLELGGSTELLVKGAK